MEHNKAYNYFLLALKDKLAKQFGGNIAALARHVNYSRGYIANILSDITDKYASYDAQVQIAQNLGMEFDEFLIYGKTIYSGKIIDSDIDPNLDDFVYIPKVVAQLAAGHGSFETGSEIEGMYSFREDWIRKKGNSKNLVLMDVTGDSMMPIIANGDTVMLDLSKTDLVSNKIFAVRVEDLIYIKYIDREPGKFVLRSHNSDYPPIAIDTAYLHDTSFQILGRAVWWCHDELF